MNERLWSPQMRKWARDAHRHGMQIGLYKYGRPIVSEGGGSPYTERTTDDAGFRILDSTLNQFGTQPRTVDYPGVSQQPPFAAVANTVSVPPWLPLIGASGAPIIYADFTTEGTTNHYFYKGGVYSSASAWMAATGVVFARSSSASFTNSSGNLASASSGVLRFDFSPTTFTSNGLLLEGISTNLVPQSNVFTSLWIVSGGSVAGNATTSPDGTNNASSFTGSGGSTNHFVNLSTGIGTSTAAGTNYTASFFVKNSTMNFVSLVFTSNGTSSAWAAAVFDLTQGVVSQTAAGASGTFVAATIVNSGNGFSRISVTGSIGSATDGTTLIQGAGAASGNSFGGFGLLTYTDNGNVFFLFGSQMEQLGFASSYMPTTVSSVSRSADQFPIPWTSTTATVFVKSNALVNTGGAARIIGALSNDTPLFHDAASTIGSFNGVILGQSFSGNFSGLVSSAAAGSPSVRRVTANGATITTGTDNSALFSGTPTSFYLLSDSGFTATTTHDYGNVLAFAAWDIAASSPQLTSLTT